MSFVKGFVGRPDGSGGVGRPSGRRRPWVAGDIGLASAKHGQDDVASRASQADDSGVVPLTLSAFSGVEILGLRAAEGCERGEDMASLSRWFSRLDLASALRSLRDWRVAGASPA